MWRREIGDVWQDVFSTVWTVTARHNFFEKIHITCCSHYQKKLLYIFYKCQEE
jgi:hypothetical protein